MDIRALTKSKDEAARKKAVHALKQRRFELEEKSYQLQIDVQQLAAEMRSIDEKITGQELAIAQTEKEVAHD